MVDVMDPLAAAERLRGGIERCLDGVARLLLPVVGARGARRAADAFGRRQGERAEGRGVGDALERQGREGQKSEHALHLRRECGMWSAECGMSGWAS